MRFTLLLPIFTLVASVLGAEPRTRSTKVQPVSPHFNSHFERQIGLTACVRLGVNQLSANVALLGIPVASVTLSERLCLCLVNGLVTEDTVARIRANLQSQTVLNIRVAGFLITLPASVTLDALARLLGPALVLGLGPNPTPSPAGCVFNANAIPNSCDGCTYDCPTEFPIKCDRGCRASPCPSGLSNTDRRRSRGFDGTFLCPSSLTACGLANHVGNIRKVECLDTKTNVEACGGCEFPLPGRIKGADCTAIDNADNVACVAGRCVVESCLKGYLVVEGKCVLALLQQS